VGVLQHGWLLLARHTDETNNLMVKKPSKPHDQVADFPTSLKPTICDYEMVFTYTAPRENNECNS
jgi:hypothetical protein